MSRSNGSRTACSTSRSIASTGISPTRGDQVAIIWEGDDPGSDRQTITYRELHGEVCRLANVLREQGVKKGDRVTIYLPMIAEAAVAMLACARIGAIHSVVFGGFSPDSLAGRIEDANATLRRSPPTKAAAAAAGAAQGQCRRGARRPARGVGNVLVVQAHRRRRADAGRPRPLVTTRLPPAVTPNARPSRWAPRTRCSSSTPRGSTGKPKGVLHTTGGYMVCAAMTHQIRLRLPRRRRLLVHRRRRLGDRPQLHRLRPARQRRHHADVRGRAELPGRPPLLAGRRQAPGQHLLHRAHRHPRPDAAKARRR